MIVNHTQGMTRSWRSLTSAGLRILGTGPQVTALGLLVSACSSAAPGPAPSLQSTSGFAPSVYQVPPSQRVISSSMAVPKGGGVYKVGKPYQVAGQWYEPREEPGYDRVGIASWYGDDFHGRKTANGEIYDMMALTAAHPTLPMPSYAYVTSLANNRTVLVRINDRGPYARGRVIDLSNSAAKALGLITHGTGQVRVRYAGPAPLDGSDWKERQHFASQPWARGQGSTTANAGGQNLRFGTPAAIPSAPSASWSPDVYRASQRSGLGGS